VFQADTLGRTPEIVSLLLPINLVFMLIGNLCHSRSILSALTQLVLVLLPTIGYVDHVKYLIISFLEAIYA